MSRIDLIEDQLMIHFKSILDYGKVERLYGNWKIACSILGSAQRSVEVSLSLTPTAPAELAVALHGRHCCVCVRDFRIFMCLLWKDMSTYLDNMVSQ